MALPITCPGCSAAFEVPDNLAGKTIRCTSCKTQLTVPTAVPVAVPVAVAAPDSGAAKKPFGWANNQSAAAAEPLPLDDAPPAAKTVPVARTVPVAKPATRAQVALDDDDDEKTNPAKADSKPAARAATKKRRDDDDDDDDDYQPRKKKNQSGGSGAMIALIAGGILALAGIAGASIYFLTGDDKKDDTAKTDDAKVADPQVTPGPGGPGRPGGGGRPSPGGPGGSVGGPPGGMPGGGMGGPGRPNPGVPGGGPGRPSPGGPGGGGGGFGTNPFAGLQGVNALGTPGAWATYTGDGFSVEFPGTPSTMNHAEGGMTMKITGVANRDESATIVMSAQLPPEAAAVDPKLILDAAVSSGQIPGAGVARDVTLNGFPGKELDINNSDGSGTMRMFIARDRIILFIAGGKNTARDTITRFLNSAKITYQGAGGGVAIGGGGPPPGMGVPGGGSSGGPPPGMGIPGGGPPPGMGIPGRPPGGGSSSGPPPGTIPGMGIPGGGPPPGMGIPGQPPGGGGGPGRPPGGGPPPGMGVPGQPPGGGGPGRPGGVDGPPPGGIGIPGQPGGGIGIPGQPGGGNTNPAPAGSNTDGIVKAKVDAFYAAAFDTDKKEFLTVSFREEMVGKQTRIQGWLNRYAYPTFSDAKRYKIPHMGTRMALDAPKGLLYVASVTTPDRAVGDQATDRAAGVGHIEIYDLNPVRAGKVEDGTDLKPVATITQPTNKTVRGLELVDDGKALVVLTTTNARPFKSQLIKYDTETRKALTTKDLPEAGWDMCKSADGKRLMVVEVPGSNRTANVRILEAADLAVFKSAQLEAVGNDIAPAPGGQFVATVQGATPNSNKVVLVNEKGSWRAVEVDLGFGWKAANNGYVEFTPDGKHLVVSSYRGKGLDVYEVTDADAPNGLKKKASILTAGGKDVGGHIVVSPDGEFLIDHHGIVLETAKIGGSNGDAAGGGIGGVPGGIPIGGQPGGGIVPPGGGIVPPGGGVQPPPGGGIVPPGGGTRPPPGGGVQPPPGGGMPPGGTRPPGGGVQPPPDGGMVPGGTRPPGGGVQPPPGGGTAGPTPITPSVGGGGTPPGGNVPPGGSGMGSAPTPITPSVGGGTPPPPGGTPPPGGAMPPAGTTPPGGTKPPAGAMPPGGGTKPPGPGDPPE